MTRSSLCGNLPDAMIHRLLMPALLSTGPACDRVLAVRDGLVNFFVVSAPGGLLCVDAGWNPPRVARAFEMLGLDVQEVSAVFLTHAHWDHALGAGLYPRADVFVGEREAPSTLLARRLASRTSRPWVRVRDGQVLTVAGLTVLVVETPGHTPGSVSYLVGGRFLFTGDTVLLRHGAAFPRRSWLSRDAASGKRSLRRLAGLDGLECLLTAHTGVTDDPSGALRLWREPARNEAALR